MRRSNGRSILRTKEGKAAVEDAIQFLNSAPTLKEYKWSNLMFKASKEHVMDIGAKGQLGHESSNGDSTKTRLRKHGNIIACYGESLAFGCISGREVISLMLIDDGS